MLVPRFLWREDTNLALDEWATRKPSLLVTLGELADRGVIQANVEGI